MEVKTDDFLLIEKGRGKVLLYNGYQYCKKKIYKNGNVWWICNQKARIKCSGSMTIKEDRLIVKQVDHIFECLPDYAGNAVLEKIQECKKRVKEIECEPIPSIYKDSVTELERSGLDFICKIPPLKKIKSGLYKIRNKHLGVDKILHNSVTGVQIPSHFKKFLLADYNCDDIRIILFSSYEARSNINKLTHYFGDGTFKVCKNSKFLQVYTIHGDLGSSLTRTNIIPLIYGLMSEKTLKTYIVLFELIKAQFPNWNPLKFTSDFEKSAMHAIVYVFPNIKVKGCYYHFGQCLWRKSKLLNLNKKQLNRRCVSLCKALALLPESHILEGWEYINTEYCNYPAVLPFLKYFESRWLKDNMIKIWCVWEERHRTTNFLEGWHYKLNNSIRRNNNFIHLVHALEKDADYFSMHLKQDPEYISVQLNNRRQYSLIRDEFIRECQMTLLHGKLSIGHFLEKLR